MKFVLPLAMAAFALTAVGAQAASATKTSGWISDSMCGAKHMGSGAACVKKCIQNGMKPVFVDANKQVWTIDNPDAVKSFYGDHVKVKATENASAKSMHIDSITAAK
ncbi:MAG: hypothetical protein ACLGRW_00780 [Acidobacteriota bacterium]|jgi:hypothetical protein